jgi:hemolysin activation/secretion protein
MDASRAVGALASVIVAASLGLCLSVSAADAPTPGAVQDTLREPPRFPLEDAPESSVQTPPAPIRDVPSGGRVIQVDEFVLTGNSVISTPNLQRILRQYEGASMTLEDVYAIADQLTAYYHSQGFGLANVTVPAQRVDEGVIHLEVIEGRVDRVRFSGNQVFSDAWLGTQIDTIGGGDVFRTSLMESEALYLNDIPGLSATAVISPGSEYGTSDVTFNVVEDPAKYRVSLDNYGRSSIGEWRWVADASFHGLRGRGDRLDIGGVISSASRMRFAKVAYGFALGSQGERIRLSANRSYYRVGGPDFDDLLISGYSNNFRLDYTRPIRRTRTESTLLSVGVTFTEAQSYSDFFADVLSRTEIALLEISYATQKRYSGGTIASMGVTVSTNFQPFELDPATGGVEGEQQRGKLDIYGNFTIPISGNWSLLARGRLQTSIDPLVDTQQMSLGGPGSVRGYGPSEVRGDRGVMASLEMFRHIDFGHLPASWSVFMEGGRVWRIEHALSLAADRTDDIFGAGIGLSINPGGSFAMRVEYAKTIGGHVPDDGERHRVWMSLVSNF